MHLLEIDHIAKRYDRKVHALHTTSLTLSAKKRVGIVGETGSGKSTLLRCIAGLEQVDSGQILFKKEKVKGPFEQLIPGHPSIAYASQDFKLPKFITVEEYLYDPYEISEEDAQAVYRACDISHLLPGDTQQLSGGEKQRIVLAKQLMSSPELLLLDEPFSNLDRQHKVAIKTAIEGIEQTLNTTIVLVAHDPLDVLPWADEIIVMKGGNILQYDCPKTIYKYPLNEYVAGLFGPYNLIDPEFWSLTNDHSFTNSNGKLIVRPEMFELTDQSTTAIKGTVTGINYMGSHEELIVKTMDGLIMLRAEAGLHEIGDNVAVVVNE